jgi:tetratricopeptide (TPR) repeat protein
VLYQLARAYETTGQPDQALATLDRIVAQYPHTPHLDEVQFRRGELLFSNKRYAEAEKAYAAVIDAAALPPSTSKVFTARLVAVQQSQALESLPSFND